MLIRYKQHAAKRRDLPWDTSHLKFATKDQLSQCVRVCQYCYLLLTTEHDLIEVTLTKTERSLALMQGISYQDQPLIEDPKLKIQLQFLPRQLMQWRVLCYFEGFSNWQLQKTKGLRLAYKFCDHLTYFQIDDPKALNCMKVTYLYHQQHRTPKQFFSTVASEFRLTRGNEWTHWLAKSTMILLKDFPDDLPNTLGLVQSMHPTLFNRKQAPVLTLNLKVGVAADHLVNSTNIKSVMAKSADIYIPEAHYCTTDALPIEWMELFGGVAEGLSLDEDVEKDIYVPALTRADMLQMEDITSPMKKYKRESIVFDKIPTHRCCSSQVPLLKVDPSRKKRPPRLTSSVPRLELGEMKGTTGVEVRRLHNSVSDYLYSRPGSACYNRPTSTASVKPMPPTKRGITERTGASSGRSSRTSSLTTNGSPNSRRKALERHTWLTNHQAT